MDRDKNQIVYLFRHKGTNYVKIGMTASNDCYSRFQSFCTYSPYGGEVVGIIKTKDALKLERELHERYKHLRLNGEFFELTQDMCDIILGKNKNKDLEDIINILKIMESKGNYEVLSKVKSFLRSIGSAEGSRIEITKLIKPSLTNMMTATEISEYIFEKTGKKINAIQLGMKLSGVFQKKRVKRMGNSIFVYLVEPIQS